MRTSLLSFFGSHFRIFSIWFSAQTGNLPLLALGVTHFVPFPELGYAISCTVIHWALYRNWALCVWSHFWDGALPVLAQSFAGPCTETGLYARHFRDGALPVPVRSFTGSRTKTGLYARWVCPLVGLWFNGEATA